MPRRRRPRADLLKQIGRRRLRGDRGSYVVEYAIATPAFLLLILILIQGMQIYHARNLALSAAQTGVDHGRLSGAGPAAAAQDARRFVAQQGPRALNNVSVNTAGSDATTVRVTVRGTVPRLLPFIPLTVSQTAAGPVERFTVEGRP